MIDEKKILELFEAAIYDYKEAEEMVIWEQSGNIEKDELELEKEVEERIEEFKKELYADGWIPCSERLPEERRWCLATFKEPDTGFIGLPKIAEYLMGEYTDYTTEEGWLIANCTDIEMASAERYYKKLQCVAWMPLPEPYKE